MKNLSKLLLALMLIVSSTSCSTDDGGIDCPTAVNLILEEYAPLLEAHLPPPPPEGLLIDPLFDWTPFYEVLAERDAAIEAIGCK